MTERVAVLGLGAYLPEPVRTNEWWPATVVAAWREKLSRAMPRSLESLGEASAGARESLRAMLELADDPFQGARERRVMPEGMLASDMETEAARRALQAAEVDPSEIDLLFGYSMVPDYLSVNPAAIVHGKLGLPERCFALSCDGNYGSFLSQLTAAAAFIAAGRARRALLVQSACGSRVAPPEEPHSAWLGDGASAAVIGPARAGRGVLASSHRTDGTLHRAFVCGVPGSRWYEEGRVVAYSAEPPASHRMMLGVADRAAQVLGEVLAEAGVGRDEVGFYACHQPSAWLRPVTQARAGLERARSVDLFARYASLGACNLPVQLLEAQEAGLLRPGDTAALFTVAAGMTWSGMLLEWGR